MKRTFLLATLLGTSYFSALPLQAQTEPPTQPEAPINLGELVGHIRDLEKQGDYPAMLVAAKEWERLAPQDPAAPGYVAVASYYLGDWKTSIAEWNRGVALDPSQAEVAKSWNEPAQLLLERYPDLVLPKPTLVTGDIEHSKTALQQQARTLLAGKKWDELEKVNASLLKSKAELPDGSWRLTWFYNGVWDLRASDKTTKGNDARTELNWRKRRDVLQAWQKARPQSSFAKVVLARSWVDGAWLARGDGYAAETPDSAMDNMEKRLAIASSLLRDSIGLLPKTPLWTTAFQQFSQIGGVDGEPYEQVYNTASKSFPTYSNFAVLKSIHLAPRWYGEEGDWEKFAAANADAIAKTRGAVEGDVRYARIVWGQQEQFGFNNIWDETKASWPRAKRGFQTLIQRNPNSVSLASRVCHLAGQAKDYTYARSLLLSQVKGQAVRTTWGNLAYFYKYRIQLLKN